MKYNVSLYFGLFFIACTSGELEPSHRTDCLDTGYVILYRSYDMHNHYERFLETHGSTSNSRFYLYMRNIGKIQLLNEFQWKVKENYPCLNNKDFESLYYEFKKLDEKYQ